MQSREACGHLLVKAIEISGKGEAEVELGRWKGVVVRSLKFAQRKEDSGEFR